MSWRIVFLEATGMAKSGLWATKRPISCGRNSSKTMGKNPREGQGSQGDPGPVERRVAGLPAVENAWRPQAIITVKYYLALAYPSSQQFLLIS